MILVCEPHWTGLVHVPINAEILRIVARAFPAQRVRMMGEATHLAELQRVSGGQGLPNVTFQPINISPLFPGSPQVVSFARLRTEWRMLRDALADVPKDEPCLLLLLSTTATSLFVASWITRLRGGRTGSLMVMHGNLNEAVGWRPRNPLERAFDLRSGLLARHPSRLRFIVLEPGIKDELARCLPGAAARISVLPHPVNTAEMDSYPVLPLRAPVRIGLVGLATKSKGVETFLAIARNMVARYEERIEFHLVGHVPKGDDLEQFSVLASPVSHATASRAEFMARLASLHYVMLPLDSGYYNLAASGAIIDAMTARKPLIATAIPIVSALFAEYGDIGHLAAGPADLEAAVDSILAGMNADRYAAQVSTLGRLRDSRTPESLIPAVRRIVGEVLPGGLG
jgi:hypothetical protein